MSGSQSEAGTTLNPGSGGDVIRDLTVTRTDGTTAKQQTFTEADPVNPDALRRITQAGEGMAADLDVRQLLVQVVAHLRALGRLTASQCGEDFDVLLSSVIEEVTTESG